MKYSQRLDDAVGFASKWMQNKKNARDICAQQSSSQAFRSYREPLPAAGVQGVQTSPAFVDVIKDWPLPNTIKELRTFLGKTRGLLKRLPACPCRVKIAAGNLILKVGSPAGKLNFEGNYLKVVFFRVGQPVFTGGQVDFLSNLPPGQVEVKCLSKPLHKCLKDKIIFGRLSCCN